MSNNNLLIIVGASAIVLWYFKDDVKTALVSGSYNKGIVADELPPVEASPMNIPYMPYLPPPDYNPSISGYKAPAVYNQQPPPIFHQPPPRPPPRPADILQVIPPPIQKTIADIGNWTQGAVRDTGNFFSSLFGGKR